MGSSAKGAADSVGRREPGNAARSVCYLSKDMHKTALRVAAVLLRCGRRGGRGTNWENTNWENSAASGLWPAAALSA